MINSLDELQKGDLVIYRSGRTNFVNKPFKYQQWFNDDFRHKEFDKGSDIMEIKRYVKVLCFYRFKTIYKRGEYNV